MNIIKYIIIIILVLIYSAMFISCNNENITISKDEYKILKGDTTIKYLIVGDKTYEIVLGSDNHEYYQVPTYATHYYQHYIDCKKCLKQNETKIH